MDNNLGNEIESQYLLAMHEYQELVDKKRKNSMAENPDDLKITSLELQNQRIKETKELKEAEEKYLEKQKLWEEWLKINPPFNK
jgi:hypothetical protein